MSSQKGSPLHHPKEGSRFVAIDLGSHTVRLLAAECVRPLRLMPVCAERRITRLAAGFTREGLLGETSMEVSREVIREYVREGRDLGVSAFSCGATGVVRRAANGDAFLRDVARETEISPRIVSETDEATLSAKGVLSVLQCPTDRVVTFDLGGSSTEFVLIDRNEPGPLWSTSLFVGAATLTERFLAADPPGDAAVRDAAGAVAALLGPVVEAVSTRFQGTPWTLVGTAGTVTTLAAMFLGMERYVPYRVNNLTLDTSRVSALISDFASRTIEARRGVPGIEAGREDIILGGAVVVRAILEAFAKPSFLVTDAGFLEGLLLDLVEREAGVSAPLESPFRWEFPEKAAMS